MSQEQDEAVAIVNLGRALARMRWDKASKAERQEQARRMVAGKKRKARRRGVK